MSIVALKKLTLIGLTGEKDSVLNDLQGFGCLHIIPLQEPKLELKEPLAEHAEGTLKAMRYLRNCPKKHYPVKKEEAFDLDEVVAQVLANKRQLRNLSDNKDFLVERIKSLTPWGDFRLPKPGELGNLRFWFYQVPAKDRKKLPTDGLAWQEVHRNNLFSYVVVLADQEPPPQAMPAPRTHVGEDSLSELREQLDQVELQLEEVRGERWSLTRWLYLMESNWLRAEDRAGLNHVKSMTHDGDRLFGIRAWLPVPELTRLTEYAEKNGLALYVEDPAAGEQPPTLLANPEQLAVGESLVGFYTTPNYRGWDPSSAVFFSFALFSAMIISDAGYAVLFGLVLLYNWRRMGSTAQGRSWRGLCSALVAASFIWGTLVGGYFGLEPPEHSALGYLHRIKMQDFDRLMVIAIAVGVAHLTIANLAKAWRRRGSFGVLTPLGWITVLWSGFLLWLNAGSGASHTLQTIYFFALGSGMTAVFLSHSERPIKRPLIDIPLRLVDGLLGLTEITKLFGDTLSYLRLVALGLAGGSLAMTFNNLANDVLQGESGLHLLSAILVLLLGHSLNIALSILGAVVHGLRLNLIEFFNWGLSGEGYPFKAFFKKEIRNE